MTRFWITLTQGVNFVLSSMEMMRGGEIYVPKIPSTTIPQLATLVSPDLQAACRRHPPGREAARDHDPGRRRPCTVELEDRYVILQSFASAARDAYLHRGGQAGGGRLQLFQRHQSGTAGCAGTADPAAAWPMPDRDIGGD